MLILDDPDIKLHHGDATEILQSLPAESVHMCVTSPPFYSLRDYGVEGQIGLEETPDEWCANLVRVFAEVKRVLRDDGTLWVEIGDSYAANVGAGFNSNAHRGEGHVNQKRLGQETPIAHPTKQKDLVGAPWKLAEALKQPYYSGSIPRVEDRIWLAAILDGEGCIAIQAGTSNYAKHTRKAGTYERKNDSFQPKVEISNTSLALIERVAELVGEGHANTKQEAGQFGRKQTLYRWTVTANKARRLLQELYPHLVAKQHEARLGYGCPSSGEQTTACWEALKQLHKGADTTVDMPEPPSLYERGWFLRSDIIWARLCPNPMPESVRDRPTRSHSYVFLLSKQPRYYWDQDAVREKATAGHVTSRNVRTVWEISTQPLPYDHYAAYPEALVERCIKAGTSERGVCGECGAGWARHTKAVGERGASHQGARAAIDVDALGLLIQAGREKAGLTRRQLAEHFPSKTGGVTGIIWNWENGLAPPTPEHWPKLRDLLDLGHDHDHLFEVDAATTDGWVENTRGALVSGKSGLAGAADRAVTTETVGWLPTCDHDTQPTPATVLDPFLGSGTTALVARRLGRHAIGIELNKTYLEEICMDRLKQLSLLA